MEKATQSGQQPAAQHRPADPGNPQGVAALVLGIMSLVIWVLGPVAVWLGVIGRRRVESGRSSENYQSAIAGQTLGMVGTVIVGLYGALALLALLAD